MKFRTLVRHLREGHLNVIRNGWMSFASASAIAISLFVLGVFLLLVMNVDNLAQELENTVEIRVHLDVVVPEEQIAGIQNEIGKIPEVSRITFVSKDEGLEMLKERLGEENREIIEGYEGDQNPLNDSFTVKVDEPRNVAAVAAQIEAINSGQSPPPIVKVQYGKGYVERMFAVTHAIRIVGIALVIGLAFTAMFLISNTIKLTIISRRREISIMKLVGATNNFIRWPFFVEGALLGIIGAAIPVLILYFGYGAIVEQSRVELGLMMLQLLPVEEVRSTVFGSLMGIGILIGIWGSTISVRKFLKV
ncbi:cell division protein FtsX [Xylanibacillus composti]|uniref:Cell division protein FtsX n=1 Tax=Xylanibacillus composti TaxID=1572762 RepID=A0A8J4H7J8_9BACL|nr:permease-like cell division protein FtsX [Xylanibacillus composti]GIQ70008.1 cell division protein FtsX [Xylanibacillus composti]